MNEENKPPSDGRSPRSMTWEGVWSGIAGRSSTVELCGNVVGISEFANRLSQMRTI